MSERIITVPLAQVRVHPDNPRLAAVADEELVESIRVHGLIDPPLCAPDAAADGENDETFVLLDGHRRFDGVQKAGLTDLTVRVRDDLVTTAQQVEVMAITGLQKELLSPVEEARAYEQLQLLGMDEAAIAKSTGYTKRRVHERLRLTGLTQQAQQAVHEGQASLIDVEAFHEFADDPTALAALEEDLGTDNYRYTVNKLRARRDRIAKNAALVAEFVAAGAKERPQGAPHIFLSTRTWRGTDLADPATHAAAGCLGYTNNGPDSYSEPQYVCLRQHSHDQHDEEETDPEAEAAAEAQRQAEAEARAEKQAASGAARAARLEWLSDHYVGLFPVKGNTKLIEVLRGTLPFSEWGELTNRGMLGALEVEIPTDMPSYGGDEHVEAALNNVVDGAPAAVLRAFARLNAAMTADHIDDNPSQYDTARELRQQLALWDWMVAAGYPMSDVDTEIRDAVASLLADKKDDET